MKRIIILVSMLFASTALSATVTGQVGIVYTTASGGVQFALVNAPTLCTGTATSNAVSAPTGAA